MSKNFLKKVREEKGVKPSELARLIDSTRQNIYNYENGAGIPNEVLIRIAAALGVSVDYILTGEAKFETEIKAKFLSQAMDMAYQFYEKENLERDVIIKIASEIYNLIVDYNKIVNSGNKESFTNSLQSHVIKGLAAKCFLQSVK